MMAQRSTIKARSMSLRATAGSGASSRSWSPRTRQQMTRSVTRWRSAGGRSWSARRLMMAQGASIKARLMCLALSHEMDMTRRAIPTHFIFHLSSFMLLGCVGMGVAGDGV
jgi:hypothetical protein